MHWWEISLKLSTYILSALLPSVCVQFNFPKMSQSVNMSVARYIYSTELFNSTNENSSKINTLHICRLCKKAIEREWWNQGQVDRSNTQFSKTQQQTLPEGGLKENGVCAQLHTKRSICTAKLSVPNPLSECFQSIIDFWNCAWHTHSWDFRWRLNTSSPCRYL